MSRSRFPSLFLNIELPPQKSGKKWIQDDTYVKTNVLKFPNYNQEFSFDIGDFEELASLSSVRHTVKKFLHKPSNCIVAVKYLPFSSNERIVERIKREINTHKFAANSSYVVDFYGLCFHEGHALLVMEYMDMSLHSLYAILHKHNSFSCAFFIFFKLQKKFR